MSKAEQLDFSEADTNEIKTVKRGLRAKSGVIDDFAIAMSKEEMDDFFKIAGQFIAQRCCTCNKSIKDSEPHIVAYKDGIGAYFCKEHIDNAKQYLDWYQEFVDFKEVKK